MTGIQLRYAEDFLKALHQNGGHDDIDNICDLLKKWDNDPDNHPLEFEFARDYLIDHNFIKDWGDQRYRYKALVDLNLVLSLGIEEYSRRETLKKEEQQRPSINATNFVMNSGINSSGNLYDSSSHSRTTYKPPKSAQKSTIKRVVIGILIAVVAGILLWIILPD